MLKLGKKEKVIWGRVLAKDKYTKNTMQKSN
jgi:hypothetical protein